MFSALRWHAQVLCISVKVQRVKCFLSCSVVVSWHNCIK